MIKFFLNQFLLGVSFFFMQHVFAAELNTGPWRFELKLEHTTVPFIIDFQWVGKKLQGTLYNGEEQIILKNIIFTENRFRVPLGTYEASLDLKLESLTQISGFHVKHNKNPEVKTPIVGIYGKTERFPEKKKDPQINLTGKWSVTLIDEKNESTPGVVVFKQNGSHLTGSVLTPTGDYRYFEGYVSGSRFFAASFDGIFNYTISGNLQNNNLDASLISSSITKISGKKNNNAKLPDAYSQTQINILDFSFPDLKGKKISLTDKEFKNKAIIVQLFGSWCPNCIDEMNYLIPWYNKNKSRGVEIVALAFERSLTELESKRQLARVQKHKKPTYPILLAGLKAEDKPMDKIKNLNNFISFPTTIFLNKKHQVIKVHAGFTGPGTGEFFENWKKEFDETVNEILR